jgi:hypothetical protein
MTPTSIPDRNRDFFELFAACGMIGTGYLRWKVIMPGLRLSLLFHSLFVRQYSGNRAKNIPQAAEESRITARKLDFLPNSLNISRHGRQSSAMLWEKPYAVGESGWRLHAPQAFRLCRLCQVAVRAMFPIAGFKKQGSPDFGNQGYNGIFLPG